MRNLRMSFLQCSSVAAGAPVFYGPVSSTSGQAGVALWATALRQCSSSVAADAPVFFRPVCSTTGQAGVALWATTLHMRFDVWDYADIGLRIDRPGARATVGG